MGLDHLWAGWRATYMRQVTDDAEAPEDDDAWSLFERILDSGLPDDETFVVAWGARCVALLNAYPYTSGHLMVLPTRAVADLEDLDADESVELWAMVRDAVVALKAAYRCEGVNVGLNLGLAAGAGVPGHLHVHVLPRWSGDTNFMTAVAGTRVLPEALVDTWERLRSAWPAPGGSDRED